MAARKLRTTYSPFPVDTIFLFQEPLLEMNRTLKQLVNFYALYKKREKPFFAIMIFIIIFPYVGSGSP